MVQYLLIVIVLKGLGMSGHALRLEEVLSGLTSVVTLQLFLETHRLHNFSQCLLGGFHLFLLLINIF